MLLLPGNNKFLRQPKILSLYYANIHSLRQAGSLYIIAFIFFLWRALPYDVTHFSAENIVNADLDLRHISRKAHFYLVSVTTFIN